MKLSREESIIYSKQIKIEKIGIEGQKKLKRTKSLVIGAGGLGCPVLIYLARLGIGYIGIMDKDQVEYSNLNRQILYDKTNIQKDKILLAKKKIKKSNYYCNIITHNYKLNNSNSIEVISYYDIIIDTTDSVITRHLINETCKKLHKIYIYGAVNEFEGQFGVFNYKNGMTYKDVYKKNMNIKSETCNNLGITCVTTGIIGTLQSIEVLNIILGLNKKCKNFINLYSIIETVQKKKQIKVQNIKQNCNEFDKYKELNIKLNNNNRDEIIIDIRNHEEFKIKHLKKAINIYLKKLILPSTIKLIQKYEKIDEIIVYCNNYNRSISASKILKENSIKHSIEKYRD
uniref:Molybdopterin biosynthesis protein n=1 Tax=Polysiphonia sertularioides TaxID=945028 RepID=A0A1Z1M9C0_9FLOR|nr:Molybdopterin biosynthesis protein [Polysiphonia sertularioides]ARW62569.1 Molybdopterin biosynthesis protein [Polysiphonia sertularioides]